jgi:uncharacterized small protein (DUF1192 family)
MSFNERIQSLSEEIENLKGSITLKDKTLSNFDEVIKELK